MNQKKLKNLFVVIAAIAAIVSVVLLFVAIAVDGESAPVVKGALIAVVVLGFILAGEFFYLYRIENEVKPNYFLYDENTKKNIPVQKMGFEIINRRMNKYLSMYASSEGSLWTDRILERPDLDMENKFKPAVAYRLLFGLADKDVDKGWSCFENASYETVEFICSALDSCGDTEVARTLRHLKAATPINLKYVRDYLVNNKAYIRTKLCNYVYDNINKF